VPQEEPFADFAAQSAVLALDCLDHAVFVLDASTHMLFASAAARRLIESGRLCVQNGLLCSPSAAETSMLRRLVRQRIENVSSAPAQMTFQRLDSADEALCLGVTAARQWEGGQVRTLATVFIAKPSQVSLPDVRQLRDHFGLTDAQARLAVEIVKGDGLTVCARRLGIAVTTARTHLRQIFQKTDTRRQAEFVRLICGCGLGMHVAGVG
jgi:DNA-binding CsgD family transcriptional regulator